MKSDNDMARTAKDSGGNTSLTPSVALLNQRLGTSPAPRMLEPPEIDLLRRCAEEVAQVAQEVFASKKLHGRTGNTSGNDR